MKVAIVGGGPGGALPGRTAQAARRRARHHRLGAQRPDDTFGFGVVFSDETLGSIEGADEVVHQRMESRFARWTDIDVDVDGQSFTVGGQGFAAMSRKELLQILQERVASSASPCTTGRWPPTSTSCAPPTTSWWPATA